MKKTIKSLLICCLAVTFFVVGCKKDEEQEMENNQILPSKFRVDIPSSISHPNLVTKSTLTDTLDGNEIYEHLANFIHLGEESAVLLENIILHIAIFNLNQPMTFSYTGEEDGRAKNCEIVANSSFEGLTYEYQMTITDAASASAADGGKAMQVFWNQSPIKGVAILKPYNINRIGAIDYPHAMYRIDYSEAGEYGYDSHMIVTINGLPLANPLVDPYSVSSLKMFAGKNSDIIDVYGNSEHPNAVFFNDTTGFNWAFVAAGKESTNVGVAEVGLPPSSLNESNRSVLLTTYSIENVFTQQIYEMWPSIDSVSVQSYLYNTKAPGYFDGNGFVQGGTSPGAQYNDTEVRLSGLTPYNPYDIANLSVTFK